MERRGKRSLLGEHPVGLPTLLVALFGAAVAWVLHLNVSYVLIALACNVGWEGIDVALAVVTGLSAAGALGSGWVAYRAWRRLLGDQDWDAALQEPRGNSAFLLWIGIVAAVLFTLIIVLGGIPPLFVRTCA